MKITAILPIKHNSIRVPGKNFRIMNGKPLYQWILNTLLEVEKISYIIIDTDSDIIFNNIPKYYSEHYNKKIFIHKRYYYKNGKDMNHNRKILIPTQNLDPIYEENSCIYIFDKNTLLNENARIADNALLFEMSHIESQDIDWEHDFILTELLMKK